MLKTTVLGGVFFLLPFAILLLVLHEVLNFTLVLVEPLAELFPEDDYLGVSLTGILAVLAVLLTCYLAGLVAQHAVFSGFSKKTDQFLAGIIPGYRMIRTRIAATTNIEDAAEFRQVVSVKIGGLKRYAFLIERHPDKDEALIFLPGTPNAETGILGQVSYSDLTFEDIPARNIMRTFQFYGRGLYDIQTESPDPTEQE